MKFLISTILLLLLFPRLQRLLLYPFLQPTSHPMPLIIAYASWAQCDSQVLRAALDGANVLVWFSINLSSRNNTPAITGALPDLDCVARTAAQIRDKGLEVRHMISIGGWNAPWPTTDFSAEEWFRAFDEWNREVAARNGWGGFDGVDWDVEGNDDAAKVNVTEAHMGLIGELSVRLKKGGYVVSMAPAQSCLDVEESGFDLELTHAPAWREGFAYHGRNLYAFWLAFYGETEVEGRVVGTFDWVGVQLYEGWSRAGCEIRRKEVGVAEYVKGVVGKMVEGWTVDFGKWGRRVVRVERERIVWGVANGWADGEKFLLLSVGEIGEMWRAGRVGGVMFWTVKEEGRIAGGRELFLAKELKGIVGG